MDFFIVTDKCFGENCSSVVSSKATKATEFVITWSQSPVERLVRGLNPWFDCYLMDGVTLGGDILNSKISSFLVIFRMKPENDNGVNYCGRSVFGHLKSIESHFLHFSNATIACLTLDRVTDWRESRQMTFRCHYKNDYQLPTVSCVALEHDTDGSLIQSQLSRAHL